MRHENFAFFLCLTLLSAGAGKAADLNCYVPMRDWQPRGVVKAAAEERGWKVRRIKVDDGCYEITGWDKQGNEIEARIDPATLEIVKMEVEMFHAVEEGETKKENDALKLQIKRKD